MNSTVKTIIFWVVILISAVALWQVVKTANSGQKVQEINFSRFMAEVDQGTVKDVTITGQEVKGKLADGSLFHTDCPCQLSGDDQKAPGQKRQHHRARRWQ